MYVLKLEMELTGVSFLPPRKIRLLFLETYMKREQSLDCYESSYNCFHPAFSAGTLFMKLAAFLPPIANPVCPLIAHHWLSHFWAYLISRGEGGLVGPYLLTDDGR